LATVTLSAAHRRPKQGSDVGSWRLPRPRRELYLFGLLARRAGPDGEKVDNVTHHLDPRQARPVDRSSDLDSKVNATPRGGSVSRSALYAASVFFVLHSMSALGIIDRAIYGPAWVGKSGDKMTEALNLLGMFTSLFLFWVGTRKMGNARFNRVLAACGSGLSPDFRLMVC
jgi:hypothetical protein